MHTSDPSGQAVATELRHAEASATLGPAGPAPRAQGGVARVSSAALFGGAAELQIDHHGTVYRLKQTSLGKLILTK